MRSYVIEDLYEEDTGRIAKHLTSKGWNGSLAGLYWLPIDEEQLSDEQKEHLEQCGPYGFAMEVEPNWVKMELLVRSKTQMRCSCIAYATPEQRETAINLLDTIVRDLDIAV